MADAPRILVVGTKNRHKLPELRALLAGLPVEVRSLADYGDVEEVEETGRTFAANATLKAVAYAQVTGELTIADDSGLCVDALGGEPGVDSAYYAGPQKDDAANNRRLLAELAARPAAPRTARFCCTIACARPGQLLFVVEGAVEGTILDAPRGANGFGYDPLFFHAPSGCAFAELPAAQKNAVSHRARALAAFRAGLASL